MQRRGPGPAERDFGRDSGVWMKRSEIKRSGAVQELSFPAGDVSRASCAVINPPAPSQPEFADACRSSLREIEQTSARQSQPRRSVVVV